VSGAPSNGAATVPDGRLRVLVLARSYPNDVFPTLGLWTEQPTIRLAEHVDVRVVSPVPWCPPLPPLRRLDQYARFRRVPAQDLRHGVEIRHPRFLVGPGRSMYALEAKAYEKGIARTVETIRKDFPFDLIHAHFIYPEGAVAHGLSRRYGVPFVVTEHAPWTGWLEQRWIGSQAVPAARAAAAVMPVSTSVLRTIRSFAGPSVRATVVPVGVDETLFRPGDDSARRSDQILYVGLINFNKGIDVLLTAVARLAAAGRPGRLLLAGGSFYRHTRLQEERLRAHAAELGLGDRVTFLGRLLPAEVARLMAASAVVVLPSRAESFGAVLVEALASGTPVVATRCGGPEDIVVDGVGELVPVGDAAALADALSRTLDNPGDYDGARLRRYAVERFGWDRVVERVHEVYRDTVR
jgi:teichuronic acid biosynthesis glycosyltransferase TuaC